VTAMAVMTKQQAKQFAEMDDFFLDLLNLLKDKGIIDNQERKVLLLTGFEKLVQALEKKKIISPQDSKEAMAKGFTSLVYALAE
jgi:hypothetical protein